MSKLTLEATVPLTSLRPYTARDYQETYPAPPPATVFGMLLSTAGIERHARESFSGVRCGIAIEERPTVSEVLRKMHRGTEESESGAEVPKYRPEYQELLSGLRFWTQLVDQTDAHSENLCHRVRNALEVPNSVNRHGALSLGESTFMVDRLTILQEVPSDVLVLRPSDDGFLAMPVWVDFRDRSRTRLRRFELVGGEMAQDDLVEIAPGGRA